MIQFNIETLRELPPRYRLNFVRDFEAQINLLPHRELDIIGLLLCAAAPAKLRDEYPVIGDRGRRNQDQFEAEVIPIGLPGLDDTLEDEPEGE